MPADSNLPPNTSDTAVSKSAPAKVDPVDLHIGQRLRAIRTTLGLSQGQVGEQIGVTFQQVQKFERAHNRITAKRLKQLSQVLNVEMEYFFEGVSVEGRGLVVNSDMDLVKLMNERESFDLLKAFFKIEDRERRLAVLDLIRKL